MNGVKVDIKTDRTTPTDKVAVGEGRVYEADRPVHLVPVMTTLVMSAVLGFGIMAFRNLPVSDLPRVDFPTIQVTAGMPVP